MRSVLITVLRRVMNHAMKPSSFIPADFLKEVTCDGVVKRAEKTLTQLAVANTLVDLYITHCDTIKATVSSYFKIVYVPLNKLLVG